MSKKTSRQPSGTPSGGQFAASGRAEADIALNPEPSYLPPTAEQTIAARARADQAVVVAIPEPLRLDYRLLQARLDQVEKEVDAAIARRSELRNERDAILDMAVEEADSDAALVALRDAGMTGYTRFRDTVRAMHPRFYEPIDWTPSWPTEQPVVPTPGLHLSLLDHRSERLEDEDPQALADAMVEFADRFVDDVPQYGDHAGKIFTDILTGGDRRLSIWYTPDGSDAVLVDRTGLERDAATGPLTDVLAETFKVAIKDRDHRERESVWE